MYTHPFEYKHTGKNLDARRVDMRITGMTHAVPRDSLLLCRYPALSGAE
jgi:hypothetical protein